MSDDLRLKQVLLGDSDQQQGDGPNSIDAKQGNSYLGAELTSNGDIEKLKVRARYKHDQGSDERYEAIKEAADYFGAGPHWDISAKTEGEEKFSFHAPRRLDFWCPSVSTEITLSEVNRNYLPFLHYAMKEAGLHVRLEEEELKFDRRQYFDKVQPEEVANCYCRLTDLGFEATVSSTGIELGPDEFCLDLEPQLTDLSSSLTDKRLNQLEAWAEQYTEMDLEGDWKITGQSDNED